MEQIKAKVKRWGNSFGVILPKSIIEEEDLEEGSEITITITKEGAVTAGDLMELGRRIKINKKFKHSVDETIREIDKELWKE